MSEDIPVRFRPDVLKAQEELERMRAEDTAKNAEKLRRLEERRRKLLGKEDRRFDRTIDPPGALAPNNKDRKP